MYVLKLLVKYQVEALGGHENELTSSKSAAYAKPMRVPALVFLRSLSANVTGLPYEHSLEPRSKRQEQECATESRHKHERVAAGGRCRRRPRQDSLPAPPTEVTFYRELHAGIQQDLISERHSATYSLSGVHQDPSMCVAPCRRLAARTRRHRCGSQADN